MELRDRYDSAFRGSAMARGTSVKAPSLQEGVGQALRHSYTPRTDDIPDEMMTLLAKLR